MLVSDARDQRSIFVVLDATGRNFSSEQLATQARASPQPYTLARGYSTWTSHYCSMQSHCSSRVVRFRATGRTRIRRPDGSRLELAWSILYWVVLGDWTTLSSSRCVRLSACRSVLQRPSPQPTGLSASNAQPRSKIKERRRVRTLCALRRRHTGGRSASTCAAPFRATHLPHRALNWPCLTVQLVADQTMPHDLARVVMWEQLYRAQTIIRGKLRPSRAPKEAQLTTAPNATHVPEIAE